MGVDKRIWLRGLAVATRDTNTLMRYWSSPSRTSHSARLKKENVQLLLSGTPNNLEQLKIYAETSLKL